MITDPRLAAARAADQAAQDAEAEASRQRAIRDGLVKALRASDPRTYTYKVLAEGIDRSHELVAYICKN